MLYDKHCVLFLFVSLFGGKNEHLQYRLSVGFYIFVHITYIY